MSENLVAVIPAAGEGSRLWPTTEALAKELVPVGTTFPFVETLVDSLEAGADNVVVVINPEDKKQEMRKLVEDAGNRAARLERQGKKYRAEQYRLIERNQDRIFIIDQIDDQEKYGTIIPLQSAHRDQKTAAIFEDPNVITVFQFPDEYLRNTRSIAQQLIDAHEASFGIENEFSRDLGYSVLGLMEVDLGDISKYGAVDVTEIADSSLVRVENVYEKPDEWHKPPLVSVGGYVLTAEATEYVNKQEPNENSGEYVLADALASMARDGLVIATRFDGLRLDLGNEFELGIADVHQRSYGLDAKRYIPAALKILVKAAKDWGVDLDQDELGV